MAAERVPPLIRSLRRLNPFIPHINVPFLEQLLRQEQNSTALAATAIMNTLGLPPDKRRAMSLEDILSQGNQTTLLKMDQMEADKEIITGLNIAAYLPGNISTSVRYKDGRIMPHIRFNIDGEKVSVPLTRTSTSLKELASIYPFLRTTLRKVDDYPIHGATLVHIPPSFSWELVNYLYTSSPVFLLPASL